MKNKNKNIPELLAPAGNLSCAMAALRSGADAVYAGISRFNAREMGENFSFDDMSRLSAYTKKTNTKFYLTLNTIVKEQELEEFGDSVEKIAALNPDAVIVQDIGVIRFLREFFPDLPIHASTQMGIHNSAGVRTAAGMGIERVILERQVTMDELKSICKSPVEIEVFIHGALCCSISGHCLFSSWMGGWSGNRGRCKQPCRRRYHGEEGGAKKSGFFFSTQDLYSLDMLEDLTEAGVCSLKIEGRLKKPDYVKSVVTAYRMMLDAPAEEKPLVMKEARSILAGSYGRKWSHGFTSREDMDSLIQYSSAGVSGRLAGTVEKTAKNGFEISVIQRLHMGDRIRVQPKSGDEGPSFTVTKMSVDRAAVRSASKGSRVFIHCDKPVTPKSMVYKIGESSAENVNIPADMPLFESPVEIGLKVSANPGGLRVSVSAVNGTPPARELSWSDTAPIEEAQNQPLSPEDLASAFSVTRNEKIDTAGIEAEAGENLFLPAGRLKKTRREFWAWLEGQEEIKAAVAEGGRTGKAEWKQRLRAETAAAAVNRAKAGAAGKAGTAVNPAMDLPAVYTGGRKSSIPLPADYIRTEALENYSSDADEIVLPFFCAEGDLQKVSSLIQAAADSGIKRFRLTSLYQFDLFASNNNYGINPEELILTASYPLAVPNSLAASELHTLGISRAQLWLELDKDSVEAALVNWPLKAEIYRKGKPFLLATRAALAVDGPVTDSRGKEFVIERNVGGLNYVYPAEVLSLPAEKDCADFYDLSRVTGKHEKETGFNHDFALI